MRLEMNPMISSYTPEVVESNYLEDGAILNIGFDPYQFTPFNPVYLQPGHRYSVTLTGGIEIESRPKYPIFKQDCILNAEYLFYKGFRKSRIFLTSLCFDASRYFQVVTRETTAMKTA